MSINTTVCLPANAQDQFYKSHNLKLNCHQQSTTSNMVAFKMYARSLHLVEREYYLKVWAGKVGLPTGGYGIWACGVDV